MPEEGKRFIVLSVVKLLVSISIASIVLYICEVDYQTIVTVNVAWIGLVISIGVSSVASEHFDAEFEKMSDSIKIESNKLNNSIKELTKIIKEERVKYDKGKTNNRR